MPISRPEAADRKSPARAQAGAGKVAYLGADLSRKWSYGHLARASRRGNDRRHHLAAGWRPTMSASPRGKVWTGSLAQAIGTGAIRSNDNGRYRSLHSFSHSSIMPPSASSGARSAASIAQCSAPGTGIPDRSVATRNRKSSSSCNMPSTVKDQAMASNRAYLLPWRGP